jgi:hypothetical protein
MRNLSGPQHCILLFNLKQRIKMKKLLLSSLVAGLLSTSAIAWDFCSDESQIGVAAGSMGAGVLIADATFGGVPGLVVGAIATTLASIGILSPSSPSK